MENDQKRPPPIYSTHTAIISPGLNMAAVAGQACFIGQGLLAVQACHLINSAAVRVYPPPKVYRLCRPATQQSLPAVRACHLINFCRLCGPVIHQSLPAVHTCHPSKSTGRTGLSLNKVYRPYQACHRFFG